MSKKAILTPISSLSTTFQNAAAAAMNVSKNAYAPYSSFHVGACFVHPDGSLTPGCNYENCTFQATCAERCCMVSANANGKRAAVAVAVFGQSANPAVRMPADAVCPPCGLCRQHLNEVAELSNCDIQLILVAGDKKRAQMIKLSEILPLPFGPSHFGVDLAKYKPVNNNNNTNNVVAVASAAAKEDAAAKKKGKKDLEPAKKALKKTK